MTLRQLLNPKSIAVIGGGAWCESVIAQNQNFGTGLQIWPVHPKRAIVSGLAAFQSLDELPESPDAAFIGVNRSATVKYIDELARMGCGGAICFASGFSEAVNETLDGEELESELVRAAGDMPILGPNCYGLVNYLDGVALWPDQHGGRRCDRGVAIIAQSSNIAINLTMQKRGLPIAFVATTGNQALIDAAELGLALIEEPRVTALGLYLEGISDLRRLEALASRAKALGKPIVVMKAGISAHAQAAAMTHTASLAGSDAGANALFERLGIGRAYDLSSFVESLKLLHCAGPLRSKELVSMSCSGGEASLVADSFSRSGASFPPLSDGQSIALRSALGPKVALGNPLDYHTYIWGNVEAMTAVFTAMTSGRPGLGLVILDFPRADRCTSEDWFLVIEAAARAQRETGTPIAITSSLAENMPEEIAGQIMSEGLIPLNGLAEAVEAVRIASQIRPVDAEPVLLPREENAPLVFSEFEAKKLFRQSGITVPNSVKIDSADDILATVKNLRRPLVLKSLGMDHKTEQGGVKINLTSDDEIERAFRALGHGEVFAEEMVVDGICEILVGILCDPAHGFVLTVAAGGTLTEIWQDRATLLVPASRGDVEIALNSLKVAKLFNGYRGQPAIDFGALLDLIMKLQTFVIQNPVLEMEINPIICTPTQAVACDALLKMENRNA